MITLAHFDDYRSELDVESVGATLAARGIAIFDLCRSRHDLISVLESMGRIHPHRDSNVQGLTILEPKEDESPGHSGFTRNALFPHTDSSGLPHPPDLVAFCCEEQADFGGDSLLVDGRKLFIELERTACELLPFLTSPDAAMFKTEGGFVSMPIIDKDRSGRLAYRFRFDDFSIFSNPLIHQLPRFIQLVRRHTLALRLSEGQGFIVNNGWWLHGRSAFRGYRRVLRVLVDVDHPPFSTSLRRGFFLIAGLDKN